MKYLRSRSQSQLVRLLLVLVAKSDGRGQLVDLVLLAGEEVPAIRTVATVVILEVFGSFCGCKIMCLTGINADGEHVEFRADTKSQDIHGP